MKSIVMVLAATTLGSAFAENWYNNGGAITNLASWANLQGEVCAAWNDDDLYWVTAGKRSDGQGWNNFDKIKQLCLGSPVGSPTGFGSGRISCNIQGRTLTVNNLHWYNGGILSTENNKGKISYLAGTATLFRESADVEHRLYDSTKISSLSLGMDLVAADERIVLHIGGQGASTLTYDEMMRGFISQNAYYLLSGDNAGFCGTMAVESAHQTVFLGGSNVLGNPERPTAAALTLCDNAAFGIQNTIGTQSATRGIRLDGEQVYLNAFTNGTGIVSGGICRYPISKAAGVTGRLVKDGAGLVTLDCAYTAGPIRVAAGTLVLGEQATFPSGQQLIICDGATVTSCVSTAGFSISYEGTGTGTLAYKEGYRQGTNGLECRVGVATEGPGTLDAATEVWVPVEGTKTLTATPDAGKAFLYWKGAVGALKNRTSFEPSVTLQAFATNVNLVAVFGDAPTALTGFTDTDGTTYAFADHVMTVTVPAGLTNAYNYASLLASGYVHEIVKAGAGALQLASVPDYVGDFTIQAGYVLLSAAGALGAPDAGTVDVRSGTAIWVNTTSAVATGKLVKLAGTGVGDDAGRLGCLRAPVNKAWGVTGEFVLSADALVYAISSASFFSGSRVNLKGHDLSYQNRTAYQQFNLTNAAFTNDTDTTVQLKLLGKQTKFYVSGCRFDGKGEVSVGNDCRCHVTGDAAGTWPIVAGYAMNIVGSTKDPAEDPCKWLGGVRIPSGNTLKVGSNGVQVDSVVGLDGPVSGSGAMQLLGGWLHWYSSENTFTGTFSAQNDYSKNTLRTTLSLHDGSVFRCTGAMTFKDVDLRLAGGTAFDLPAMKCTTNDTSVVGGPRGDSACGRATIAAIDFVSTDDNAGTLFVDSPVAVTGVTHVARGTLKVGTSTVPYLPYSSEQLPVFSNLVFEAGTTFDFNGNDLTLANLSGFPTVQNAGAVTLSGDLKLTAADLNAGNGWDFGTAPVVFGPNARIVIDDSATRTNRKASHIVLQADGITGVPVVQTVAHAEEWVAEIDATGKKLVLTYCPKGVILTIR